MKKKIIEGVQIINKKVIIDERGKILHMLRKDDKIFLDLEKFIFHM